MQKTFNLTEMQTLRVENLFLKERIAKQELASIQRSQTALVREIYPEFTDTNKCMFDNNTGTLIVEIEDLVEEGIEDNTNGRRK